MVVSAALSGDLPNGNIYLTHKIPFSENEGRVSTFFENFVGDFSGSLSIHKN